LIASRLVPAARIRGREGLPAIPWTDLIVDGVDDEDIRDAVSAALALTRILAPLTFYTAIITNTYLAAITARLCGPFPYF
jgi:hypothetical protein